jgi:RluA family pseudouridine synthase
MRHIRGITIIHEDPDLIVIEKDAGLLTCETRRGDERTVENLLTDYVRKGQWKSSKRVYLVHRLDRETSGIMMVAKSERVQEYFRSAWNELTEKTYLARVEGVISGDEGVYESYLAENENMFVRSVKDPKDGKLSITQWKVVSREEKTTVVEVALKSGRKNQIRVHFSEAGFPIVGDSKYGNAKKRNERLHLHAWKLSFKHPHTGREMSFETPVPTIFQSKSKGIKK